MLFMMTRHSGVNVRFFKGHTECVAFSSVNRQTVSSSRDKTSKLCDTSFVFCAMLGRGWVVVEEEGEQRGKKEGGGGVQVGGSEVAVKW